MALDNRAGNAAAKASLAKLPQDSALTWYFKATLSAREGEIEFMNTVTALSECFKRDRASWLPHRTTVNLTRISYRQLWICLTYNHNKD